MSVSRVRITLEVKGKGRCELELVRHLAPLTVGSILRVLPIESRVYKFDEKFLYFDTPLLIGAEKQRDSFKRGEVGFMVSNNTICIFLKDVHGMRFNPIGRIISDMELLDHVSNDVVVLA